MWRFRSNPPVAPKSNPPNIGALQYFIAPVTCIYVGCLKVYGTARYLNYFTTQLPTKRLEDVTLKLNLTDCDRSKY